MTWRAAWPWLCLALCACPGEVGPAPASPAAVATPEQPAPPAAQTPAPPAAPATEPGGPPAAARVRPMPRRPENAPALSLSVNGAVRPVITRGWPARAVAHLEPPGPEVVLEGAWGWTAAEGGWRLSGAQTAALTAGEHRLVATAGAARVELVVTVRDEPREPTAADRRQKLRGAAEDLSAAGDWAALLELAQGARGAAPQDPLPPELEGDALAGLGRRDEAARAYAAALELHRAARPGADPPPRLARKQLEAQGGY